MFNMKLRVRCKVSFPASRLVLYDVYVRYIVNYMHGH